MKVYRRALQWFGRMERMDERPRPRKVKAAIVQGQHGRGSSRFGLLNGMKKALIVRKVGLQEATQLASESVWREHLRV